MGRESRLRQAGIVGPVPAVGQLPTVFQIKPMVIARMVALQLQPDQPVPAEPGSDVIVGMPSWAQVREQLREHLAQPGRGHSAVDLDNIELLEVLQAAQEKSRAILDRIVERLKVGAPKAAPEAGTDGAPAPWRGTHPVCMSDAQLSAARAETSGPLPVEGVSPALLAAIRAEARQRGLLDAGSSEGPAPAR
jgi:hypothetical protein